MRQLRTNLWVANLGLLVVIWLLEIAFMITGGPAGPGPSRWIAPGILLVLSAVLGASFIASRRARIRRQDL